MDSDLEARLSAAWVTVRDGLRRDVGARSFDRWLGRITLGDYCSTDRSLTLVLPSAFMANWVASNYAERLALAWRTALSDVRVVKIAADATAGERIEPIAAPAVLKDETPAAPRFRFDPKFTFDTFVVGQPNRIACNAARAIAEGGPMRFNPLFVYGPTGQGKTHLLHAIGHGYTQRKPQARALAMSAERFMIDFVNAMRAKDTMAFKERLRSVDILLIDDFQFIAGKETTQEGRGDA